MNQSEQSNIKAFGKSITNLKNVLNVYPLSISADFGN
jgi:hypothetical protein